MKKDDMMETTNRLLRVVIALLIREQGAGSKELSLKDRIVALKDLGLAPIEIAEILGRTGNHINKELSELKKLSNTNKK